MVRCAVLEGPGPRRARTPSKGIIPDFADLSTTNLGLGTPSLIKAVFSPRRERIQKNLFMRPAWDGVANVLTLFRQSMTTAIIMLAKKMTREQRLPFEVSIDPFFSEGNMAYLRRGIAALDAGQGVHKTMAELERMEREGHYD